MKFKVGDKVRVKFLKEILEDPNTEVEKSRIITSCFIEEDGKRVKVQDVFTEDMKKMCGKCFTIRQANKHSYFFDSDSMYYDWLECWVTEPYTYIDSFRDLS